MSGIHDRFLVHRWSTGLLASNKPGTDPHGLSTPGQVGRKTSTVVHCAGADNQDGSTSERGFLSLDFVHDSGNQDRRRHIAGVSASFTSLSTDQVNADFESLGDVLGMTDHLMGGENEVLVAWLVLIYGDRGG